MKTYGVYLPSKNTSMGNWIGPGTRGRAYSLVARMNEALRFDSRDAAREAIKLLPVHSERERAYVAEVY